MNEELYALDKVVDDLGRTLVARGNLYALGRLRPL
jgi:hypothetical protein